MLFGKFDKDSWFFSIYPQNVYFAIFSLQNNVPSLCNICANLGKFSFLGVKEK